MFGLPVHSFADVSDIREDGFFVAFSVDGWRGDCVAFAGRCKKGWVGSVKRSIESVQELLKLSLPTHDSEITAMRTNLRIGIFTITLQPRFVSCVESGWHFCTLSKWIFAKLRLIYLSQMFSIIT